MKKNVLILSITLLTLYSCSKEENQECKECTITTRLESGSSEQRSDTTYLDCSDPTNFDREEPYTWEYQDSTYIGTKKTIKRCR